MKFTWHEIADEDDRPEEVYDEPPEQFGSDGPDYEYVMPGQYLPLDVIVQYRKPAPIMPGVFFTDSVGMLVAPPYVGKTLLAIDLGLALASCQSWLKWKPLEPMGAIVYALDSPGWEAREQVSCLMAGRGLLPETPLPFALVTREAAPTMRRKGKQLGPLNIMDSNWLQHIAEAVLESNVRLIVFDSFSKIHDRDENDRIQMEAVNRQLSRLAAITHSHVLVLHHTPVMDRGTSVYAGRGSSVISASVEFSALMTKAANGRVKFSILKGRGSDEGESEFDIQKTRVEGTVEERAVKWEIAQPIVKPESQNTIIWRCIKMLGKDVFTSADLGPLVHDAGVTGPYSTYMSGYKNRGLLASPKNGLFMLTKKGQEWDG
jgi:hypothetical protein